MACFARRTTTMSRATSRIMRRSRDTIASCVSHKDMGRECDPPFDDKERFSIEDHEGAVLAGSVAAMHGFGCRQRHAGRDRSQRGPGLCASVDKEHETMCSFCRKQRLLYSLMNGEEGGIDSTHWRGLWSRRHSSGQDCIMRLLRLKRQSRTTMRAKEEDSVLKL